MVFFASFQTQDLKTLTHPTFLRPLYCRKANLFTAQRLKQMNTSRSSSYALTHTFWKTKRNPTEEPSVIWNTVSTYYTGFLIYDFYRNVMEDTETHLGSDFSAQSISSLPWSVLSRFQKFLARSCFY